MKRANQLPISPIKEGLNVLKVLPSYFSQRAWSRPVSVNFLITSRCNSKCETCDSWKLTDHSGELSLEDFTRLAGEISSMGIPIVTIGGGEPTLRQDLWDIVSAYKNENIVVQLTTNGLTLKGEQRKQMYRSGLDRVTFSYDSHIEDLYTKIRGVPGAEKLAGFMKEIMAEKPEHLELDTNTVLCKDNADTFLETIDYLIDMNIPKINFSAVTTAQENYLMTSSKSDMADIPLATIEKIKEGLLARKKSTGKISASTRFIEGLTEYYANPQKLVYPCYAGYLTIDIFQDGSVHGCGNLPSIANVKKDSLPNIWKSKEAETNRKNMADGNCPNCYLSCKMELAIAANPKYLPQFSFEKLFSNS